MSLIDFIRNNRGELQTYIENRLGRVPRTASCYCPKTGTDHHHTPPRLTYSDIKEWVRNDETLYLWAKSEGVRP
jgi:hypothetical protein